MTTSSRPSDLGAAWHERPGVAEQARSFGAVAAEYDRVRPGYPAEVVRWALGPEPRRVLDLGAGTGKLTRVLLREGHRVVAVEPDPGMRAHLSTAAGTEAAAEVATEGPVGTHALTVLDGTGEALPLPDASLDAALVAQAWHWMDHDRTSVELARTVRPGGTVVLMWNLRDHTDPLARAIAEAVGDRAPQLVGRVLADSTATPLTVEIKDPRFRPDGRTSIDSSVRMSVADLVALAGTWSYVALAPQRTKLLRGIEKAATRHAERKGPHKGTVLLAQTVEAFRFVRT